MHLVVLRSFTVHVEGVGHVCSFALFDFDRHGDARYGAPADVDAEQRSRDGKMEMAYLNFRAQHPSWRDERGGDGLLLNLIGGADGAGAEVAATATAAAAFGGGAHADGADGADATDAGSAGAPPDGAAPPRADTVAPPPAPPTAPPALPPPPLGVAHPAAAHQPPQPAVAHSVRFADIRRTCSGPLSSGIGGGGVSALGGGGVSTLAGTGFGASALGASALQLLTRSSCHPHALHLGHSSYAPGAEHASHSHAPPHAMMALGESIEGIDATLAASVSPLSLAACSGLSGPHQAHAAASAVSPEVGTQQLTAGLYSQLDGYFASRSHAPHGATGPHGSSLGQDLEAGGGGGMRVAARLPPLVGTDNGDYELAPPDPPGGEYEMRAVAAADGPPRYVDGAPR